MNFEEIKQQILDFAKAQQVEMDYTAKSIEVLDEIMEIFHEKLNQCSEEEGCAAGRMDTALWLLCRRDAAE